MFSPLLHTPQRSFQPQLLEVSSKCTQQMGLAAFPPIYHHSSPSWDLNTSPALALSL